MIKAPCANVAAIVKGAMTPEAKAREEVEQVKRAGCEPK